MQTAWSDNAELKIKQFDDNASQKTEQLEGMQKDWSAKYEQKTKQIESMQRKLLILGAVAIVLSIAAIIR